MNPDLAAKISGLPLRGNAKLRTSDIHEIRRLYRAGLTAEQIAPRFGVRRRAITKIVAGHTWRHVPDPLGPIRPRLRGPAEKLDARQQAEVRRLYNRGHHTMVQLAAMHEVCKNTIWRVINLPYLARGGAS